eukprot:CCRYP_008830-RA/>CCRYP_008830-RA protein AED:0.02 eAED:0.02 QI:155/1/1/1/0/0/2/473/58
MVQPNDVVNVVTFIVRTIIWSCDRPSRNRHPRNDVQCHAQSSHHVSYFLILPSRRETG